VLTSHPAERSSALSSVVRAGAALLLSAITLTTADAGSVIDLSCVAGARSFNCVAQLATAGDPYVRVVPEAVGEAQKSQLAARDRKWVARCHPVAERDSYGVARYHYAAPGCEYGLGSE
jgi:hypothetical protein